MKYFGTDGFHGGANADLVVEPACKIDHRVGCYYDARKGVKAHIVLGKDICLSSNIFLNQL